MSAPNKGKKTSPPGPPPKKDQYEPAKSGEKSLEWQTEKSQKSMTTERGSSSGGETRRGDKKPQHTFSNAPKAENFGIEQLMKEQQGGRGGTGPWVPVWSFPKPGGGQRK